MTTDDLSPKRSDSRRHRDHKPASPGPTASQKNRAGDVQALAAQLHIEPRRPELLRRALTHKSAEQELGLRPNERLEFLGDAVLGLVIAEHLFRSHPNLAEGALTKVKAVAVSEPVLARVAGELNLGRYLLLSKGEEQSGGRSRPSILADALEAVFGAVYLDRGSRACRAFILRLLEKHLQAIENAEYAPDYKTLLQEKIQEHHRTPPTYRVVSETGPDHDRTFIVEVRVVGKVLGGGTGKSKKQAEQEAARAALEDQ